ncbi:MAG: polysaccharide deacetylase family protein [Alistipes sp.]|nr:polysaccharide deacetylase family protein [Alistipes sp.]
MYIRPPQWIQRLFPSIIWTMPESNHVYLTFDDGPTPGVTEWIVDCLAEYDAHATFFCLGKNAEQHPHLFRMIGEAGHRIGNHTYSHQKGWGMSLERYIEDVDFANDILHTDLFRAPYGRITPAQARRLSERYHMILWDILSRDYSQWVTPRQCLHNVTRHVQGGSIVVFHDSVKAFRNLRYALPRTLQYIKDQGLICSSIDNL